MSTSTDRFSIAKDLKEWIDITGKAPWGDLAGSDEATWKYSYSGKKELLPFMNIYTEEIEGFSKYFPDMDIWLKNIHWDSLFKSAGDIITQMLKKIKEQPSLIILHASPLEVVIIGELFKTQGISNIVYNFNRVPAVNSISKTLEAALFLVSWDKIPWLSEKMQAWTKLLGESIRASSLQESVFLFDENDLPPNWNISRIDAYVKSAIGWKEHVVTYKIDELPQKEFLLKEGIKHVYFFDTDISNGIDVYYQSSLGDNFSYHSSVVKSGLSESIGYFEDYVTEKNGEYLIYKKEIIKKNESIQSNLIGGGGTEKRKGAYNTQINAIQNAEQSMIPLREGLVYLGGLAVILPLFLLLEVNGGQAVFQKSASGSWNYTPSSSSSSFRTSGSSSWGSSFSRSVSTSSSSSSISSFGGGGFSKGGG